MKALQITVTGAQAQVAEQILLTGGMVGLPAEFTFDEMWEGLEKIALFRAGGKTVSCPLVEDGTQVPWEILKRSGCTMEAGVYGCNESGTLVIPTVWAAVGVIQPGADPEADPGREPQLPQWQQNRQLAEQAMAVAQSVRDDADAGAFQGQSGYSPVRGVDYWTQADKAEIRGYVEDAILGGAW